MNQIDPNQNLLKETDLNHDGMLKDQEIGATTEFHQTHPHRIHIYFSPLCIELGHFAFPK